MMNYGPSKTREGGVLYSLGRLRGDEVVYYFPKVLIYLEAKGKITFGEDFQLFPEDREIISSSVISSFVRKRTVDGWGVDQNKGILLSNRVLTILATNQ